MVSIDPFKFEDLSVRSLNLNGTKRKEENSINAAID